VAFCSVQYGAIFRPLEDFRTKLPVYDSEGGEGSNLPEDSRDDRVDGENIESIHDYAVLGEPAMAVPL
jgi:hypothetical protein